MMPCMVADKPGILPENRVVEMWRDCLPQGYELVTEDGEPVRVIYPGRRNCNGGADFLDAVIDTGCGLVMGDIEIHVNSSGWRAHGHHRDPAYDRVILHVVYRNDTGRNVTLHNGRRVPTLALNRLPVPVKSLPGERELLPCRNTLCRAPAGTVEAVLDDAGQARFQTGAAMFRDKIAVEAPGQVLYEAIMTALGYTGNKVPFQELARQLPLQALESNTRSKISDEECLAQVQSRLLGGAGLLPSQLAARENYGNPDTWVEKLESIWLTAGGGAAVSRGDWHLSGIRPGNFPVRRLAAMSYLLVRYREEGLLNGLVGGLRTAADRTDYHDVESRLMINAEDYWARNLVFGTPVKGATPALLGKARAAEIIVNVLLPFTAAAFPESRAQEIYNSCPLLASNTLEKHMMRQLGLDRGTIGSARRQQGLIHIYRTFCSQGKCEACALAVAGSATAAYR